MSKHKLRRKRFGVTRLLYDLFRRTLTTLPTIKRSLCWVQKPQARVFSKECDDLYLSLRNKRWSELMALFWSSRLQSRVPWVKRKLAYSSAPAMYRLSRRFRRRFGKDKEEKKDKHALDYVIVLLDSSDLSFNLHVSFDDVLVPNSLH